MFKANNLACKVAIDDSSEASLLGINVSFIPVLGAIKVSDVVLFVMLNALERKADRISCAGRSPLKIYRPQRKPAVCTGLSQCCLISSSSRHSETDAPAISSEVT